MRKVNRKLPVWLCPALLVYSEFAYYLLFSGQLSDSACGTLKRLIKNDLKSGKSKTLFLLFDIQNTFCYFSHGTILKCFPIHIKLIYSYLSKNLISFAVKFLNTAAKVVRYCSDQPILREVTQSRYLTSKTMWRSYHHVTKDLVETGGKARLARREVETLPGISSFNSLT